VQLFAHLTLFTKFGYILAHLALFSSFEPR